MKLSEYQKLAAREIDFIYEYLNEVNFEEDFDLINKVLYIYTNRGDYVVNQHSPTQQIWLSSPVSNAGYFNYDEASKTWKDKKNTTLRQQIFTDLNILY